MAAAGLAVPALALAGAPVANADGISPPAVVGAPITVTPLPSYPSDVPITITPGPDGSIIICIFGHGSDVAGNSG